MPFGSLIMYDDAQRIIEKVDSGSALHLQQSSTKMSILLTCSSMTWEILETNQAALDGRAIAAFRITVKIHTACCQKKNTRTLIPGHSSCYHLDYHLETARIPDLYI